MFAWWPANVGAGVRGGFRLSMCVTLMRSQAELPSRLRDGDEVVPGSVAAIPKSRNGASGRASAAAAVTAPTAAAGEPGGHDGSIPPVGQHGHSDRLHAAPTQHPAAHTKVEASVYPLQGCAGHGVHAVTALMLADPLSDIRLPGWQVCIDHPQAGRAAGPSAAHLPGAVQPQ